MSITVRLGRVSVELGERKASEPPTLSAAYLAAWRELTEALQEETEALRQAVHYSLAIESDRVRRMAAANLLKEAIILDREAGNLAFCAVQLAELATKDGKR